MQLSARELAATEERYRQFYETEAISEKVAKFVESQIDAKARAGEWVKQLEEARAQSGERGDRGETRAAQVNNHEGTFRRLWKKIPVAFSGIVWLSDEGKQC